MAERAEPGTASEALAQLRSYRARAEALLRGGEGRRAEALRPFRARVEPLLASDARARYAWLEAELTRSDPSARQPLD